MTDKLYWPREQELLLLSTQAPFDNQARDRFAEVLEGRIDWVSLIEVSYKHAVTPLLCRTLELVSDYLVPPDVLENARSHLRETRCHNELLTQELLRILQSLGDAGIPAIPFKGPVLAEHYYGDPGLRRYGDLDFLVAEDAAVEVVRTLRDLGYAGSGQTSSRDKAFVLSPRQDAALWRYAGEYIFFHSEKSIAIEPHWAFVPPTLGLDLDYGPIWTRARKGRLADGTILCLSREDTILSLALHGAKSNWTRLQWISDFDRAVKCEADIDWRALLQEARRAGILRILLTALQLVRLLFKTELDAHAREAIDDDPRTQRSAKRLIDALFQDDRAAVPISKVSTGWLAVLERRHDQMAYIFRTAVTPRVQHFETLPLPDFLFPAYYVFKPVHDYIALPLWIAAKKKGLLGRRP
jgi:hypothetical protein